MRAIRAICVFSLVFALASPALAGPENSVIGAKNLQEDMVHEGHAGMPGIGYGWWNKGPGAMDWSLNGDLIYGEWPVTLLRGLGVDIGLGLSSTLRWHLKTNTKEKVTNDVAIVAIPGIAIARTPGKQFGFGVRLEVGAPLSIDVHEKVNVVTGGFIPVEFIIVDGNTTGAIPLMVRMGVEWQASDKVVPWLMFDLGPGILVGSNVSGAQFAWRLLAGVTFWSILGNKGGGGPAPAAEPAAEAGY